MSMYNMLFGMNPLSGWLLAVVGMKQNDVERFRDVHASPDGTTISIYSRTGGGNREDYPQTLMRHLPGWRTSVDDDFDSTYCTDEFDVPAEWQQDVANLGNIMEHGLRAEFMQHLAKTLQREPTEDDKNTAAYESEQAALKRTKHFMANGHTFVPQDDYAMKVALELAEANGGKLRSCWGIMPIVITVKQDFKPHPNAKSAEDQAHMVRVEVQYDVRWTIDEDYWRHCQERFAAKYPLTMAAIGEDVRRHINRQKARA